MINDEQREQIIQVFLEMERDISTRTDQFPFGRLNGFKQGLTFWLSDATIQSLHNEAYARHIAEFVDGKYVPR